MKKRKKGVKKKQEQDYPVNCTKCGIRFLRSENKFGDCRAHTHMPDISLSAEELKKFVHSCCDKKYNPEDKNNCSSHYDYHEYNPFALRL